MGDGVAAPVVAGLAVGVAFVLLFAVSNIVPTMCGAPGLQIGSYVEEERIGMADMIVYGTVLSAELQPVYYTTPFGDIGTHVRYTVTIFADRYMLDKTGEGAKIITFREYGFGCAYPFRSEVDTGNPFAVEHKDGEKAVFLIHKLDPDSLGEIEGDWYSFALFDKYAIVGEDGAGNKLVQNKWNAGKGIEPVTVEALESKVDSVIREAA